MKRTIKLIIQLLFTAIIGLAFLSGCIRGGSLVSKDSSFIKEYLVNYRADGSITYHLVKTEKGLAVLENAEGQIGALLETHWEDIEGDHFSASVCDADFGGGNLCAGFEVVVPKDRTKNALHFFYPRGNCVVVQETNGMKRPVPIKPVNPTTLIPVK